MSKILIIKNNIVANTTFIMGIEQVKGLLASINFPAELTVVESTRKFNSVPFIGANPEVNGGYHVNPAEILQEEKNYGDFDAVCLVFDPLKVNGNKPTNPTDSQDVFQIPSDWFTNAPEVFAQYFLHELCHEMFWKYSRPDITHSFYTSEFAQKPNGIIEYYLSLLKTFPTTKPKREATLNRTFSGYETLGSFNVPGKTWKSLELPWQNNFPNISCIPPGKYTCKWTFSPKFLKYTYEVQGVPKRSGIRIHSANFYYQLQGCIALGLSIGDINHDGKIDVLSSRLAIKELENYFQKQDFTLTII